MSYIEFKLCQNIDIKLYRLILNLVLCAVKKKKKNPYNTCCTFFNDPTLISSFYEHKFGLFKNYSNSTYDVFFFIALKLNLSIITLLI
jgi:hypothetical protein